ncbi:hypothetical protein [Luteibacter yeojuensis]
MTPTSRTRCIAAIALGWALVAAIAYALNDAFGACVFLAGVTTLVLWRVVPRLRRLLRATADDLDRRRRRWRHARAEWAKAFSWPIWLKLSWYTAALLVGVSLVLTLMNPTGLIGQVAMPTAWRFLMTVAAMDLLSMLRVGARRANGKAVGFVVASVGTALVAALALSLARKLLFTWTGEDPGAFPAALTLATAVLVPVGWLALIAAVSAILMVPMVFATLWQMANTRRMDEEGGFHTFLVALRPILVCSVPLFLFTFVWSWRAQDWPTLRGLGITAVVALDYWERPVCRAARGIAVRLDDSHYSVVVGGHNLDWRFKTVACASGDAAR